MKDVNCGIYQLQRLRFSGMRLYNVRKHGKKYKKKFEVAELCFSLFDTFHIRSSELGISL